MVTKKTPVGFRAVLDCGDPPGQGDCRLVEFNRVHECLACVDSGNPDTGCTIEQDVDPSICTALGQPGFGELVLPDGVSIIPLATVFDLYGDNQPFFGGNGAAGLVKYYLGPASVEYDVKPLYEGELEARLCGDCAMFLCHTVLHNLTAGKSWDIQCVRLFATEQNMVGACCGEISNGIFECFPNVEERDCNKIKLFLVTDPRYRGVGSRCDEIDCDTPLRGLGACCLRGRCMVMSEANCMDAGGSWLGPFTCRDDSCPGDPATDPNFNARRVRLDINPFKIGFMRFDLSHENKCFQLIDNNCFSTGPDSEQCGGDPAGQPGPCWQHVSDTDASVLRLDSINIVSNMSYATGGKYRHHEPECVQIANAALALVVDHLFSLTRARETRQHSYDGKDLNLWQRVVKFPCDTAPVVTLPVDPDLDPPPDPNEAMVTVRPWKTSCAYPADLIISAIHASLRLSVDPENHLIDTQLSSIIRMRVAAVYFCQLFLKVRLRPGFEDNACPLKITTGFDGRCTPLISDDKQMLVYTTKGCSRVPFILRWKGLLGPAPFSSVDFSYSNKGSGSGGCFQANKVIDGTLIPGEVNDLSNPSGPQCYSGDVVLFVN